MDGLGDETKLGQLVLIPLLGLIIARRRRTVVIDVVVEVAEGSEEGTLLGLGLLEVLLERLLVKSSLRLVLGGVLALVLVLAGVILVGEVLVLLGAVDDEMVGVSTAVASFLWTPTTSPVPVVVVKPRKPADDQR
jgi:hypothetical protein